jgi:hypothetical protein
MEEQQGADAPKRPPKRTLHLRVPVRPEEESAIKTNADRAGLSIAEYLRRVGIGHQIRGVIDEQKVLELAKVNADMGRLGGLLKLWLTDDKKLASSGGVTEGTIRALLKRLEDTQAKLLWKVLDLSRREGSESPEAPDSGEGQ